MIARLALAAVCGGLIGLEREMHSQPAGLRTHMVVAIGAALIMIVSIETAGTHVQRDPGRIAAQVVSGIGFLGAGAILRFGMSVKGLTTAACLWTAAGIGLACGMGYVKGAATATVLVLTATFFFDKVEKRFLVGKARRRFVIGAKDSPDLVGKVETILLQRGLAVKQIGIHKDLADGKAQLTLLTDSPDAVDVDQLTREITAVEGVESIDID